MGLLDKYTMRSKVHKETMGKFIELILEQDIMREEFEGVQGQYVQWFVKVIVTGGIRRFNQQVIQEKVDFLEKVGLVNLMLGSMDDQHTCIYDMILRSRELQGFLCQMMQSGVASISLKALEIVQGFTRYYVQWCIGKYSENDHEIQQSAEDEQSDYEIITMSHTRLYLIQLIIKITFLSIEIYGNENAYVEFSTFTLLHQLFNSILPAPSFSNEIYKSQNIEMYNKRVRQSEIPDLREIDPITLPEFEIIDPIYLSSRLDLAFRIWNYVQSSLESKWTNIRKLTYRLLASMLRINFHNYGNALKTKLKNNFPVLLNILLESNNTEAKKGGLYILGSFCGLSHDCDLPNINIKDNLFFFRKNESYVSIALWQKVFDMQTDWDVNVRDAANILIQFCAPRESIRYFNQMENEKYELKLSEIQNKLSFSRALRLGMGRVLGFIGPHDHDVDDQEDLEDTEEMNPSFHDYSNKDQSHTDLQSPSESSENNSYRDETDNEFNERYFYVDKYDNEQLKELMKLFIIKVMTVAKDADCSPKDMLKSAIYNLPTKLWIDKQGAGEKDSGYYYNDQMLGNDKITDFIEDRIDATSLGSLQTDHLHGYASAQVNKQTENKHSEGTIDAHEESEYLIFERHFESQPFNSSEEEDKDTETVRESNSLEKDPIFDDDLNTEDLGIIDLEDDDVFDNIDDDKLPFLKNTYSKKNRPNNSKSVAAGSKSKANRIDFGREDVGPDITPKNKSEPSTPEKDTEIIEPEKDLQVDDIDADNVEIIKEQSNVQEIEISEPPVLEPEINNLEIESQQDLILTDSINLQIEDPAPAQIQQIEKEEKVLDDFDSKNDQEAEGEENDDEGESDIDKYLDFQDDDEGEDATEFVKFKEEYYTSDKDSNSEQEIDVFDVLKEKKVSELVYKPTSEIAKNIKAEISVSESLEEEKKDAINVKKITPLKTKHKRKQEISITTTVPPNSGAKSSRNIQRNKITNESNTAPIFEPKIKALNSSKSSNLIIEEGSESPLSESKPSKLSKQSKEISAPVSGIATEVIDLTNPVESSPK